MRFCTIIFFAALSLLLLVCHGSAQSANKQRKPNEQKQAEPQDAIKIETDLVSVPVIVSDRNDVYVPDLAKHEFELYENGVKQDVAFFSAVKEPFHVVLLLDTSLSTLAKQKLIRQAAQDFVTQLQPADRVKVIAFNDYIDDLGEFSNDRAKLRVAIERLRPGQGTKLYDAMKYALNSLARVQGRKAIVLFSDGVDSYSDTTHYDDNIAQLEEAGVIVYPIRYNTRRDVEATLRQQRQEEQTVSIGGRPPIGTTPPTSPGETRVPTGRPGGKDPYGLPTPPIILPRRDPRDRYPDNRYPDDRYPDNRYPAPGGGRLPDDRASNGRLPAPRPTPSDTDSIVLDGLYRTAMLYLNELASGTGGKIHYAEDAQMLPEVFARIADELRNQYSLGYYPANQTRDGKYRKLQVKVSRKNVVVRARPGYRAPR